MPNCLIVSPPLSLSFPHEVPRHPPMQALIIGAALEREGATPVLVDLYHRGPAFGGALADEAGDEPPSLCVLVLNEYTRPLPPSSIVLAAEAVRGRFPDAPILVVGVRSADKARALLERVAAVDAVGFGDAEPVTMAAWKALVQGAQLRDMAGLCWREARGVAAGASLPLVEDLDSLPFAGWHLVDWRFYSGAAHRHRDTPFFRVMAQRGCPYDCFFCGDDGLAQWGPVRTRSVDSVMAELRQLVERYGAREIQFIETTSILDSAWMLELCDALRVADLGLVWSTHVRANLVTRELLEAMAAAGCWNVLFGVETGSEQVLDDIRKGIRLQHAEDTVRWCRELGIESTASFMFGHPGETPEQAEQTIRFALALDPDYAQFFITKLHGGATVEPSVGQLMAEWTFHAHDIYGPPLVPVGFRDLAQLEELQRQAYRRFYLRPRTLARHLGRVRSGQGITRLMAGAQSLGKLLRS
jgi:anaerobic magnesium-protoporphyrin IX monomethyl ester cyclase